MNNIVIAALINQSNAQISFIVSLIQAGGGTLDPDLLRPVNSFIAQMQSAISTLSALIPGA